MSRQCTAAPGGSADLQRGKSACRWPPTASKLPPARDAASRAATSISSSPCCTPGCRTGRAVGTALGTHGHLAEAPAPAASAAAVSQHCRKPQGAQDVSWGQNSLFPPRRVTAHSTGRTILLTICLQPAFRTITSFASLAQSHPEHPTGTPAAAEQPLPGSTMCPRASGLFSKAVSEQHEDTTVCMEQRSRVHPGKKPEQSAAELVLGGVCSEHSPSAPRSHPGTTHSHPQPWSIAHLPTTAP